MHVVNHGSTRPDGRKRADERRSWRVRMNNGVTFVANYLYDSAADPPVKSELHRREIEWCLPARSRRGKLVGFQTDESNVESFAGQTCCQKVLDSFSASIMLSVDYVENAESGSVVAMVPRLTYRGWLVVHMVLLRCGR